MRGIGGNKGSNTKKLVHSSTSKLPQGNNNSASDYVLGRIVRLSPPCAIATLACWPLRISPLIILSAKAAAICFDIRRFKGLAPYLGLKDFITSHSLTSLGIAIAMRRSSTLVCNSFNRILTISLKACLDKRRKKSNSSILLMNSEGES